MRPLPRSIAAALLGLALVAAITACGDDDDASTSQGTTSTTGASSTTAGAEPSFTELQAPSAVTCDAGASTVVAEIAYATANAETIEYTIDGEAPGAQAGFGPSGTIGASLPCDGRSHVVAVTPFGAGGTQGPTEDVTISVSAG